MIRPDEYFVLFICALCIVMAIGFLTEHPLNLRKILLSITLFPVSYILFGAFLMSSKLIYKVPFFLYTMIPFGLVIAPLLFLYVRTFLQDSRSLAMRDYLHFLFPLFVSIITIPMALLPVEEKILHINNIYNGFSVFSLVPLMNTAVFIAYSVVIIVKITKVFHRENPLHKRLLILFLFHLSWNIIIFTKTMGLFIGVLPLLRWANFLFALDIFLLYFAFHRYPYLLNYANLTIEKPKTRSKSLLNTIDIKTLKRQIELMMDQEKLYCDEDLSLGRLAHALEITPHQLSEFLNEHYGKNFNTFINGYRIQYALSLLSNDPDSNTLSVAFASGFNSYSAFYSAFKKETGRSPGEYKTNNKS